MHIEPPPPSPDSPSTLAGAVAEAERRTIEAALHGSGGDLTAAARRLGISHTTLWRKMKRLGLGGGQRFHL